jgi:hypothetical protein
MMSREYDTKAQIKLHHLVVPRLIGYITPLIVFVTAWQWFRPQNELGWIAVGIAVVASMIIPLATLSQARNEAHSRPRPRGHTEVLLDDVLQHDAGFAGPEGDMPMDEFLASQP